MSIKAYTIAREAMAGDFLKPFDAEKGAQLIETVGTPEFAPALLHAANELSMIDELFGYLVIDGQDPETIITASFLEGSKERLASYVERFFRHDPAVHEFRQIAPGESFVLRVPVSNILAHDYRRICFLKPGFVEKLSFGWRGQGYMLVLSFYRVDDRDQEALQKLSSLVALILPVMVRHHGPIHSEDVLTVLKRRLGRSYPALSMREREVCARTLIGQSTRKIAQDLDVLPGTVLTYRQRSYQKYGISRCGELLEKILN